MATMDIDYTRRNKKPRLLTDSERDKLDEFVDSIHYSSRYGRDGKIHYAHSLHRHRQATGLVQTRVEPR